MKDVEAGGGSPHGKDDDDGGLLLPVIPRLYLKAALVVAMCACWTVVSSVGSREATPAWYAVCTPREHNTLLAPSTGVLVSHAWSAMRAW